MSKREWECEGKCKKYKQLKSNGILKEVSSNNKLPKISIMANLKILLWKIMIKKLIICRAPTPHLLTLSQYLYKIKLRIYSKINKVQPYPLNKTIYLQAITKRALLLE